MQYGQHKCLAQMIEPLVAMPAACGPRGMAPLRKRFTNEQDLAQAIEPFVVAASYLPAVKSITSKYVAQQKFLVQELYKLHANLAFKQTMLVKIHAKFFDDHCTTWQLAASDRDAWSTTMALRLRCVCKFVAQAMRKKKSGRLGLPGAQLGQGAGEPYGC